MALGLSADVLRAVVHRLSLWDARIVQLAHPACAEIVHDVIACMVDRVLHAERPEVIDAFLRRPPSFHERVHGDYVMFRTPRNIRIDASCDGAMVVMRVFQPTPWAMVEVQSGPHRPRPTFATLEKTLQTIWWFAQALAAQHGSNISVVFRTRALVHHPPSEVLNTLASTFVERYCLDGPCTRCM